MGAASLAISISFFFLFLILAPSYCSAQVAPWPVPRHDRQRTSLGSFIGPRGSWTRGQTWRVSLDGPAIALNVDVNSNAVILVNTEGSTSSSIAASSSGAGITLTAGSSSISLAASASSSGSRLQDLRSYDDEYTAIQRGGREKRKQQQHHVSADDDAEEVVWYTDAGALNWTVPPMIPLSFASAISVSGEQFYALTYNAEDASYPPTLSMASVGSNVSSWATPIAPLFTGLIPPLAAHLDFFPLSNVVLASAWQTNSTEEATFAAVSATTGELLWISSSFFFTPTSDLSFNFAISPDESTAYTVTLTSKGVEASAWDIDMSTGNFSRAWHTHNSKATEEGALGYAVLDVVNDLLFTSYSPSAGPSLLWVLNASSGDTAWQLPFQAPISGIALAPHQGFYIATADGYLSQGWRSAQNLTLNWRLSVCPNNSPMQSPISDLLGVVYMACGARIIGITPNQNTCFSAISHSGEWIGPVTPVLAGPSLLYAAAQRYLYAWRDAPPAPPPPRPPKLKLWEILALSVGGPLLLLWLVCAVAYLSLRESPQEEEVSLLRPIYQPPPLAFTRFMMWMSMLVCFPYGRSAAHRLRNAERFIHDNDYAKARRASRRSLIYSLKGLLIGLLFIAVILGVLLWVLVWQHIVN